MIKKVITAIGEERLSKLLKGKEEILVKSQDIQYQEGILEALDTYSDIDTIIVKEDIIGELDMEELIHKIIMVNQKIEIILITRQKEKYVNNANISYIVDDKEDYVEKIMQYFFEQDSVDAIVEEKKKQEQVLTISEKQREEAIKKRDVQRYYSNKQGRNKETITVIGNSGVRKDCFYCYHCKDDYQKKNSNH